MVLAEEEYQKNEENCADENERKVFEDKKGERRTELIFRDPNQPAKPAPATGVPTVLMSFFNGVLTSL